MRRPVSLLLLFAACRIPPASVPDPTVQLTPPELSEVSLTCDDDARRWTLEAQATSWTGGGRLTLASGSSPYTEVHEVPSIAAAADGSGDRLRLRLSIAEDWRDASPGTSTAFLCSEPPAEAWLLLDDPDGNEVDCRILDEDSAWVDDCP